MDNQNHHKQDGNQSWFSSGAHHRRRVAWETSGEEVRLAAVKRELIAARERIEQGSASAAVIHMKWAMEKLLPEGQQYCSQTLDDNDPEKTLQGFLDNIIRALNGGERR